MSDQKNVSTSTGLVILLIVGGIVGYFIMDEKEKLEGPRSRKIPTQVFVPNRQFSVPAQAPDRFSMRQYKTLQTGMNYLEACKVMGDQGVEMSRLEIGNGEIVMYMWQNDSGSNVNCQFQDNKLTTKAQFGLK